MEVDGLQGRIIGRYLKLDGSSSGAIEGAVKSELCVVERKPFAHRRQLRVEARQGKPEIAGIWLSPF